jgi:hypothetical protein
VGGIYRRPAAAGEPRPALGFSAYRALASSAAKLGGAPLTAIGDIGTGMATRRFNGLPIAGIVGDYLKQLNPARPRTGCSPRGCRSFPKCGRAPLPAQSASSPRS